MKNKTDEVGYGDDYSEITGREPVPKFTWILLYITILFGIFYLILLIYVLVANTFSIIPGVQTIQAQIIAILALGVSFFLSGRIVKKINTWYNRRQKAHKKVRVIPLRE